MKNSSRLVAEIERNRSRSSNGWLAFADSSNTLRLNSSHDNSRLMNRSGEDNKGGGSSFAAATAVDDECCFFVATAGAKRNLRFRQEILIQSRRAASVRERPVQGRRQEANASMRQILDGKNIHLITVILPLRRALCRGRN